MKKIVLNEIEYQLIKEEKNAFDLSETTEKCTDYFIDFDYIFGDYAYDKLRLKGFYDHSNPKVSTMNDIETLDFYIENYCAYGAKWFLLKKLQ